MLINVYFDLQWKAQLVPLRRHNFHSDKIYLMKLFGFFAFLARVQHAKWLQTRWTFFQFGKWAGPWWNAADTWGGAPPDSPLGANREKLASTPMARERNFDSDFHKLDRIKLKSIRLIRALNRWVQNGNVGLYTSKWNWLPCHDFFFQFYLVEVKAFYAIYINRRCWLLFLGVPF